MNRPLSHIFAVFLSLFATFAAAQELIINEFMALNDSVLTDEDRDYSDWIELKNISSNTVNLSGWCLTDNAGEPDKWRFPSTNMPPGSLLVVFASDKNRALAGSVLHTNFKLSGNGEYLGLIRPDGTTVEHAFAPQFPPQIEDVSYGFAGGLMEVTLLDRTSPCTAAVPADNSLGTTWRHAGFNDSSWASGTFGVGYDTDTRYDPLINIDLFSQMYNRNCTVYIRAPFDLSALSSVETLTLHMKYDDGFIAYLNGVEIASAAAPADPTWNSAATADHNDTLAEIFVDYDVTPFKDILVSGVNVLAIHGLNRGTTSSDMLIIPELRCTVSTEGGAGEPGYLNEPTPGAENSEITPDAAAAVQISIPGMLCTSPLTVEITPSAPVETIYYTLNGSEPTTSSAIYTGAITISATTSLRARGFVAGLALGPISSETYLFLDSAVRAFTSDLPVVVVDNLGGGDIPQLSSQPAFLALFEKGSDGRTRMTGNFTLSTRAGIRRRGETSLRATDRKPNLAIETWSPGANDDHDIAPLGMPADSDWVLWAPWYFDPAGIRNAFIYSISNQSGNYAVRTRFVEVFLNAYGGNVTMDDYAGFYLLEEKIKRGKNRVDVEDMTAFDNAEPAVSGGYLLRIDKTDPDQNLLSGMAQPSLYCIDPLPAEITPQQESWISEFIIRFEAQLRNADEITGYPAFIDQDAFIDHNILNMLAKNCDGLRLSTYMSKQRSGKLAMGPIWDFDRSMDSTDSRDNAPEGWQADTKYIDYDSRAVWWGPLFENADFWQRYIDHWQSLRSTVLSDTNVFATIDAMAAQIAEAKARDIARWAGTSGYTVPRTGSYGLDGTQQGEINYLKWWLSTRMAWVDAQFISRPAVTPAGGVVAGPVQVTLSVPAGTTVYYTTDGSDPRSPGGAPSASAAAYSGPFTVNPDCAIRARAWNGIAWGGNPPEEAPWSGMAQAVFTRENPAMLPTEIHYNPAPPLPPSDFGNDDFEFIELRNVSGQTLDLTGYAIAGGVEFSFSDGSAASIPDGARLVVVRDLQAFSSRYSTNSIVIAGQYSGKLSNDGENIRLEFHGEKLFNITYNDGRGWPCAADGGGHSLIPLIESTALLGLDILDHPGYWKASTFIGGSPGTEDPATPAGLLINEVIAHTDTGLTPPFDSNDRIELYNPTDTPITLDNTWFLSDSTGDLRKWNIPAGTLIPARGRVLFTEDDFHPARTAGFGLNKAGEMVILSSLPGNGEDRIADCLSFAGQINGESLGRHPDGDAYFQRLTPTPGTANQLPAPGIRIQELMYHPWEGQNPAAGDVLEYIMLTNASASAITLEGLDNCTNTWHFSGGIDYTFAPGTAMSPGEKLWIVPFNPQTDPENRTLFCTTYGLDPLSARLLGPYAGRLSDSGERIALECAQPSDDPMSPDEISWIILDEIIWLDETPWPESADGTGLALRRIGPCGNNPLHWTASAGLGFGNQVIHEKLSPGNNTWSSFTLIDPLSNSDYADINTGNGVSLSVVSGTLNTSGGNVTALINGTGPLLIFDVKNAVYFDLGSSGRIHMNLQRIIPIAKINTYTWHLGNRQNQHYTLYYSDATSAPEAGPDIADPTQTGWKTLGSVNTDYEETSTGQIGVSFYNRFGETMAFARHLLWDLEDASSSFNEFDVYMKGAFVTNFVPEVWLNSHALPATDAAALADSDGDRLLNWEEFFAGTDPTRADSVFKISQSRIDSGGHTVKWKAVAGRKYTIQFKSRLTDTHWTTLATDIPGTEPECEFTPGPVSGSGFIRVLVE